MLAERILTLPLEAVIDQGIGDDRKAAVLLGGESTPDRTTKDRPQRPGRYVQAKLVTQRALHVPDPQGRCIGDAQAFRNEGNEVVDPALLLGIPVDPEDRQTGKPGVAEVAFPRLWLAQTFSASVTNERVSSRPLMLVLKSPLPRLLLRPPGCGRSR